MDATSDGDGGVASDLAGDDLRDLVEVRDPERAEPLLESGLDRVAFGRRRRTDGRADGAVELVDADDEAAAGRPLNTGVVVAEVRERVRVRWSWSDVRVVEDDRDRRAAAELDSALSAGGTASEMMPGTRIRAEIRK